MEALQVVGERILGGTELPSGCKGFDLVFTKSHSCSAIQFTNNHTYSISIMSQSEGSSDWKILLWNYVLMSNPHSTGRDAEGLSVILGTNFFHKEDFIRLRILLSQPSPHWQDFGITELKLLQ